MSFQFSRNLLADLQSSQSSQSPSEDVFHPAPASQTAQTQSLLHSQNGSQQNTSQGSLHSQNLLGSQSQEYLHPPQHNIPQRPKFPRSQSSQSLGLASQPPPSFLASRVPYSRFNQTPAPINISLAHSLKQVQRKLDDFPVQVAKMLEEGFDYLQTEAKKHSRRSRESSAEVCQVLDKIQTAAKEKNDRVKKVLEECAIELENYAEAIQSQKILQERSEEIMKTMNKVIVKQAAEVKRLKKEKDESKEALKIKSESKLLDSKLLPPSAARLPRAFTQAARLHPSPSSSSSSSAASGSVRQFKLLDDLMLLSDSEEEEVAIEDNSPGLGVDFDDLIAITDSEEEVEEVMVIEE